MQARRDPLRFLRDEMAAWEAAGLRRAPPTLDSAPAAARARVAGLEVLVLCSNAYLGLQTHPDVVAAAKDAAAEWGTGSGASRLVSGSAEPHRRLEEAIARLKGTEDAVLFGSGTLANLGTVPALVGRGDLVVSDRLNHASLIDGCRLSRARVEVYGHGDTLQAGRTLAALRREHRRCLVTSDGVFSMDGDQAPLAALAEACTREDAVLMVDDAHGTGVLGPGGAGTAAHQGVAEAVDVHMGTLSKALGAEGGFVAGRADLCEHLRNRARSYVYSTAPAPPVAAAAHAALRVLHREPERRLRLHKNAAFLRCALREAGFRIPEGETPIIPVLTGEVAPTMALAQALWDEGVFVTGIRPPTVPEGAARLRVTVTADHSGADLEDAVAAFVAAGRRIGFLEGTWASPGRAGGGPA